MTTVIEIQTQLQALIENPEIQANEVFNFFGQLDSSVQKAFKPYIKETQSKINEARKSGYRSDYFTVQEQIELSRKLAKLSTCGLYVCNYTEYMKLFRWIDSYYLLEKNYYDFRPSWLQLYINDGHMDYKEMLELHTLGYECGGDIANGLAQSTYSYDRDKKENIFDIEHFSTYPVVLEQHIWLLFTEPSEVHFVDRYHRLQNWYSIIAELVADNKIDRLRVLRECLLTSTRNFNRLAVGWFFDLFTTLEPSDTEIQTLMPELLLVLNGTHSKPINMVLKRFKLLAKQSDFSKEEFITAVPVLLSSEIKAVITNTFAVLEQLAKNENTIHAELCNLACHTLIHTDEKIQSRTSQFLIKYGSANNANTDTELVANIACYYDGLFSSVQQLLSEYFVDLAVKSVEKEIFEFTEINHLHPDNIIEVPTDFDDQIFFITQAFENNEVYHFDVYLEVIKQLTPKINADNIASLAPVLKSAERAVCSSSNRMGAVEQLMGMQFINIMGILLQQIPCLALEKIYKSIQDIDISYASNLWGRNFTNLLEDIPLHKNSAERIFTHLLIHSRQLATQAMHLPVLSMLPILPMLSTPTHTPCFIDVAVFCQRLSVYQHHNIVVDITDFQIAVARLVLPTATQNIEHTLTGEYADIINYLTGVSALDIKQCQTLELWAIALYRKCSNGNQAELQSFIEHFELQESLSICTSPMLWEARIENKRHHFTRLHVRLADKGKPVASSEKAVLYHQDMFRKSDIWIQGLDKLLLLSPHNPDLVLLSWVMKKINYGGAFTPESEGTETFKVVTHALMNIWQKDYAEICYLFLGCALISPKKPNTQLAGELWLKAVSEQNMDNQLLGIVLGTLEQKEFQPLKRFTDLINDHLMNISNIHNIELVTLISNMIANMNDTPIKGTKKLLELYLELLIITHSQLPQMVESKLVQWKETKSLNVIVKKLGKL